MSKIKGLKLDESNYSVTQEINLEELTGLDLTDQTALKREIGQAIIDKIIERTESGKSAYGGSLGNYSKEYKDSLEFKAFGKSDPVDLKLTGDMLGSIDIIDETDQTIILGFLGELENAKAYGHQTGMKGSKDPNRLQKPRPFFGMGYEDIRKEILPAFRGQLTELRAESQQTRDQLDAQQVIRDLLDQTLEDEDGV